MNHFFLMPPEVTKRQSARLLACRTPALASKGARATARLPITMTVPPLSTPLNPDLVRDIVRQLLR